MSAPENTPESTGTAGTVPLFATPFTAVNSGADLGFNTRLAQLCESGLQGRHDLLESADATAVELKRLILGQASAVVAGLCSIGVAEFGRLRVEARGWCSIVKRGEHVPAQHFPGASWLTVYCVQAGEPDAGITSAGVLRLYERRLGSIYRDASTAELKPPFRFGNHTWKPVPGWMALFPAHVPHEVSVVRSDTALILVFALLRFG
ncbi:MAG TPA: hypothetical protein VKB34_19340 [Povalibacter sp.]|nr:hypothetical protein [Povalibacter sp.]